jgi:hypothetical protein
VTWLRRASLAFVALALLLLLGLAIVLPRIAASDTVRARLEEAVADAAGLPFRYVALEAGLLPLRLELRGAELGYEGADPAASAERVELRLALLPLLRRTVLVDELIVESASAKILREDGRVRLRGARDEAPAQESASAAQPEREARREFAFGVRAARIEDLRLELEDEDGARAVAGPLAAKFSFGGGAAGPSGPFALDLDAAEVRYRPGGAGEDAFAKPPGVPARLAGDVSLSADGSASVSNLALAVADLDASGSAEFGERAKVALDAPAFSLESLAALVPAAGGGIGGRAALEGLSFTTEPPTLAGEVQLAPLELYVGERTLHLEGPLRAEGATLRGEALRARLGDFEAPVDLLLTDVFGEPRVSLDGRLVGADSSALVAALSGGSPDAEDVISGPLDLEAHLAAAAGDPVATLAGSVVFEIAPGRLRGVSLLRSAVESAGLAGSAALAAGEAGGGSTVQRFYDDQFESLGGSVVIKAGVAHTDDFRLVYRHYIVDLEGDIALDGLALDMTGTLTIDEELDAALQGGEEGRRRVVPLARVGGTLESPRVQLTSEAIRMIAGAYATERRRAKWESKIDEYLGEGSGRELLDALLSGGSQKETDEPDRSGEE